MAQAGSGTVRTGFELVAEEFSRNFTDRGEVGAAFAATLDGEVLVDLWGGFADSVRCRPWSADTAQVVFSGGKGFVALCLLVLADRGLLDLEAPVARDWPEFAAHGKGSLTVAEVASHRCRLPAVRTPISRDDLLDPLRLATLLGDQGMETDPRAAFVYHPLTYGWLCGEIVRRVDGRSVGAFFAEEIARPLGLDLWIGIGPELEDRVARLEYAPDWGTTFSVSAAEAAADPLRAAIWANPPGHTPEDNFWNLPAFHQAEIPAATAIGTARSIARLYGCLARGGELDGVRIVSEDTLVSGRRERSRGVDPFLGEPMAFGVGFQLQTEIMAFGPPPDAYGHRGAGGSVHGVWPTERIGVSYAMNQLRASQMVDPRADALLTSLYSAVKRQEG